jgi:hypothetical protein
MVEMIWLKAKGKIDMMSVEENEPDAGILAQIRARYRFSLEFERNGRFHALLEAVKAVLKR